YTRDVFELAYLAKADRLREVLREQPELARAVGPGGDTPLMWVNEDAPEVIELLLAHGADPSLRREDGTTAADHLMRAALVEAADALRWWERDAGKPKADPAKFLRLASLDWRSGGPERARQTAAAGRILRRNPSIARESIYTAVVCGDLE